MALDFCCLVTVAGRTIHGEDERREYGWMEWRWRDVDPHTISKRLSARARTRPSLPPKESEKKEEKKTNRYTHTHTLEESVTLHVSVLYPRLRIWSM
jgi:hypothetical protein